MKRLGSAGFSYVSLIVSLLILFALMSVYLREFVSKGPNDKPTVTAIEATRQRAAEVELQQRQQKQEMDEAVR